MTRPLPALRLALLAAASLFFATASCSKKTDDPAPTTGGLAGTVSPADALATVTATDGGGLTFVARPAAGIGAFALADLKPGTYALSFAPASGYAAPAPRTTTIAAGQTAAADTVFVVGNGTPRGTMTWTKGGIACTATLVGGRVDIDNQIFSLTGHATVGDTTHVVGLTIGNGVGAVRTYSNLLGLAYSPDAASAGYSNTIGGFTTDYSTALRFTSRTTARHGSGNIVVTRYNASAHTLSGTFDFSAINTDDPSNVLTANITNGRFDLRY